MMSDNTEQELLRKLNHIISKQDEMSRKQDGMLTLLTGNPLDRNDNGLVGEVAQNTRSIQKLKDLKDKALWTAVGATLFGGYGVYQLLKLFLH